MQENVIKRIAYAMKKALDTYWEKKKASTKKVKKPNEEVTVALNTVP